jgi:hypothetical protein
MAVDRRHDDGADSAGVGSVSGFGRRTLLRGAAGAALGTAAAAAGAFAQKTGIMPGGGTVPFRLPLGALDHLDRNSYVHNMEVHAHFPDARISSGEPLMVMWARGRQRLLPAGSAGWLDISEGKNPVLVETKTPIQGCVAYNSRLRKWIMMSSAGQPLSAAGPGFPHGQHHEEVRQKALSYTGLRGIRTYDISDARNPVLLQEFSTGKTGTGTHHNFYDGGQYAYLEAGWDDQLRMENPQRTHSNGIMIVDMSDPANVKEVSRWWAPGQRIGEEEEYKKLRFAGDRSSWTGNHGAVTVPRRVEDGGKVGYTGFGHFGLYVLDLSDIRNPKPIGHVQNEYETMGSIPYHTVYPVIAEPGHRLHNVIIGIPETIEPDCREPEKPVQLIDVSDPTAPRIVSFFPRPVAPPNAPYTDFCLARGRFGPHNSQAWLAPGTSKPEFLALAYFNAGLRIFDMSDPTRVREVAYFVPPRTGEIEDYRSWFRGTGESVFVEWDRNLIWLATHGGTYCLSTPALGTPDFTARAIERWTVPHGNVGWDAQGTAASVHFGRSLSQMG